MWMCHRDPPLVKDWAVCMSEVSKGNQLTSVSSCRLMNWFISVRHGCWASHCLVIMGSLLQRCNPHFLTPISSQKPWGCRRSTLHVVSESTWLAPHLYQSYGSWTITEGAVLSLKPEVLDVLSRHRWSFLFLSSLPSSKSGVEQAFIVIWTHKNI